MLSPSLSRITNRMRSSITELSFHGIPLPPPSRGKSVTHVSGTFCYLCVEPHIICLAPQVGLEPTTLRLTAECSTIELLRSKMEGGFALITTDAPSGSQLLRAPSLAP